MLSALILKQWQILFWLARTWGTKTLKTMNNLMIKYDNITLTGAILLFNEYFYYKCYKYSTFLQIFLSLCWTIFTSTL